MAGQPLARTTDPLPSYRAADRIAPHVTRQALQVLELVRAYPGRTATELGAIWAARDGGNAERLRLSVARRAPDLLRSGLIRRDTSQRESRMWAVTP